MQSVRLPLSLPCSPAEPPPTHTFIELYKTSEAITILPLERVLVPTALSVRDAEDSPLTFCRCSGHRGDDPLCRPVTLPLLLPVLWREARVSPQLLISGVPASAAVRPGHPPPPTLSFPTSNLEVQGLQLFLPAETTLLYAISQPFHPTPLPANTCCGGDGFCEVPEIHEKTRGLLPAAESPKLKNVKGKIIFSFLWL